MTCPWLQWTTNNLSGMHMVSISTPVCVNFELRPGAGDIHICWFNFDALAQGNAYKPTKEPINYRGPGGDRTHDLQTEATPPAASCPARTPHATEIAPKNATPMTCPWLHWTTNNLSGMHMVSISTPVCVNFELRPGAGDIHICWFDFDALAEGNAYKPTKKTDKLSWTRRGSNSRPPDWGNSASCQLSSTYASRHWNRSKKRNSNDVPVSALDN